MKSILLLLRENNEYNETKMIGSLSTGYRGPICTFIFEAASFIV